MAKTGWLREIVLVAAAMAIGWWAHGERTVHADSHESRAEEMNYQFMSNNINNALTIYSSSEHALYVYQGASSLGSSKINCSYKFHIPKIGGAIERENCPAGIGLP